jgi:hypothetical protein
MASEPLAQAALDEVVGLHAFFESWLGGTGPDTDAAFARLERALGPKFSMVTPAGSRLARPAVIGWLRGAHGVKAEPAPFRIAIHDAQVLHVAPGLVAVSYVEEQRRGGQIERRLSTALLRPDPAADDRLQWLLLHETFMPPGV